MYWNLIGKYLNLLRQKITLRNAVPQPFNQKRNAGLLIAEQNQHYVRFKPKKKINSKNKKTWTCFNVLKITSQSSFLCINLQPSSTKEVPPPLLFVLTFIFHKLDHIINSKNRYGCFSRKLVKQSVLGTILPPCCGII